MKKWILIVVLLALVGAGLFYGPRAFAFLRIGTTFAAQQTCACVHLGPRPLESCVAELGSAGRFLSVESQGDTVKATALFGLFSGEARNEEPFGCHPVK